MAGRNWWLKNNYDVFYTVDMFRLLNSVETVCILSKKNANPKDCVEIGVDAEDYYRIKSSEKDI